MTQADELGRYTANTHTHVGGGTYSLLTIKRTGSIGGVVINAADGPGSVNISNAGPGSIQLDSSACFEKVLSVREVEVCVNGITKYMLIVGSEAYGTKLST